MLWDIVQGLLHDPEDHDLHRWRNLILLHTDLLFDTNAGIGGLELPAEPFNCR